MAKYDFFISYSHKDSHLAQSIAQTMGQYGYSVFYDMGIILGMNWADVIADAISNSTYFLPIITENFLDSHSARMELNYAFDLSKSRGQMTMPLLFTDKPLPLAIQFAISHLQANYIRKPEDLPAVLEKIHLSVSRDTETGQMYEKLAEYRTLGHAVKAAQTLCQLIELCCKKWENASTIQRRSLCMELSRLLEQLSHHSMGYNPDSRAFGYSMLGTMNCIRDLISGNEHNLFTEDLFFSAFAVQAKYWEWDIRNEAVDLGTGGDVFSGCINPFPIEQYAEYQKPYIQAFEAAYALEQHALEGDSRFSPEEIAFIRQAPKRVLTSGRHTGSPFRPTVAQVPATTPEDEILLSIAKFMQEGNMLFDVLRKRGIAGDFMKCLLTSYERLKAYCQIVGATDVAAECVDRIVEIRGQMDKPDSQSVNNEKAENGIKSLLGFTLRNSGSYDVFISFKSEDSDLAEKVYSLCQRHMKVPFWSKRTLPELSKSEYEDAIYDALRKAKHFVVVLSNLEYLQANWVQREMKSFDRAITEGRKPGGNFVFVATDDVYEEIIRCNKLCLDERYCGYQILKMSEYEKTLMQYIS